MQLQVTFRNRGVAVLGALLLLFAGGLTAYTRRVLDGTTIVRARVELLARRSVIVSVPGRSAGVPVAQPWWSWPGRYRRGQSIEIRFDPRAQYFFPFQPRARRNAWADLWLTPALLGGIGGALVLLGLAMRR